MIISLGKASPQLNGKEHFIAESATIIGSVIINDRASVWFNAVIRGDNDTITIGTGTNIQDGAILHTDEGIPLTVYDYVTVGHKAVLHGCTIGPASLIGINAVILNNASIGKHCIIGANSLIPAGTVIPDGSLVMGTPGRIVRKTTEEEIDEILRGAEHYINKIKTYTSARIVRN
ncbi:MAG TPA: gamma carbonic anhydrase family protein [Spirochaetota bacterium]|nr:gamma carbonic anhydrase family protein [Spirochaetota bacterium]HPI89602.1 gamma carbonic anhydrase family protein [Spirochaetota bacterium]HPR48061.1 gamma carbonic anhydrase family protein [Spirochaetota bacterium]